MKLFLLGLTLLLASGCDFIGGADTLIRGSNNFIARAGDSEAVARAMAELDAIPEVTDDELQSIYAVIRQRAAEGDLEAVQVILRLAAFQRSEDTAEAAEAE
jgi:hypothetical protein